LEEKKSCSPRGRKI
jgi:hypothetical protein